MTTVLLLPLLSLSALAGPPACELPTTLHDGEEIVLGLGGQEGEEFQDGDDLWLFRSAYQDGNDLILRLGGQEGEEVRVRLDGPTPDGLWNTEDPPPVGDYHDGNDLILRLGGQEGEDFRLRLGGQEGEDFRLRLGGQEGEDFRLRLGGQEGEDVRLRLGGQEGEDFRLRLGGQEGEESRFLPGRPLTPGDVLGWEYEDFVLFVDTVDVGTLGWEYEDFVLFVSDIGVVHRQPEACGGRPSTDGSDLELADPKPE